MALVAKRCSKLAPTKNAARTHRCSEVRLTSPRRPELYFSCNATSVEEQAGIHGHTQDLLQDYRVDSRHTAFGTDIESNFTNIAVCRGITYEQ